MKRCLTTQQGAGRRGGGLTLLMLGLLAAGGAEAGAPEWPQWRGPDGQGHAPATVRGLPLRWSEHENVVWKTAIPGRGHSSPVIDGTQLWLTSAIETPAPPAEVAARLKENQGNDQPLTVRASVEFLAVCLDTRTGKIRHEVRLFTAEHPQWVHQMNSYASPSPVIEPGRLYCHFGTFGTACVDTDNGRVLWTNRSLHIMHENGPGSSPVRWRNLLIFHCDGSDRQYVVALDKATGEVAWRTPRSGGLRDNPQLKKSYGTPVVTRWQGRPALISTGSDWLYAYDPADGRELWRLSYGTLGFSIVPRPVVGHGNVYLCTGFVRSELLAVSLAGPKPRIVWRYRRGVPKIASPLLVGDEIYIVSDSGGLLTCLDARDGKELWRERLGGNHASSPLYADGRIYLCSQEGATAVIAPGREFRLLATNRLEGAILATPAAVGRALYVRTDRAVYRLEAGRKAERP